jgi:hypothetical protein
MRIQDETGRPVEGALFQGTPSRLHASDVSDVFGRVFRTLKKGEQLKGVVAKEGSEPASVSTRCTDDVELKVALHKR